MKKITIVGLLFLILSGVSLAEQSGEQKKGSSMEGMMQEMMKGKESGESGTGGMMGMMKMMEQCGAMMESMHTGSGEAKEGQKK